MAAVVPVAEGGLPVRVPGEGRGGHEDREDEGADCQRFDHPA